MSNVIPSQHPAVVLRSHYVHLRTLLAIAMVAVVGLTVTLVAIATDDDGGLTSATSAAPVSAPAQTAPGQRYDGGPEEGTRGVLAVPSSPSSRYDGGPEEGTRGVLAVPSSPSSRYDGGPEEGTRGPNSFGARP